MNFIALQLAFNFGWGAMSVLFWIKRRKVAALLCVAAAILFSVVHVALARS